MRIKCWGSRGSISVSGSQYNRYGGDTTCFEIQSESGEIIIVDAGTGIRRLGKSLVRRKVKESHLLLTHTHWDHIIGIPFFHPMLCKDCRIIVQDRTFDGLNTRAVFGEVMKHPFFPVGLKDYRADIRFDPSLNGRFSIGPITVESIPTSHSKDSLGYKFTENGKTFVFLTDNELGFAHAQSRSLDDYIDFCRDADVLYHDTEYRDEEYDGKKGWGHSSVSQVLDLALRANVGQLGLIHFNQDRIDVQVDEMVEQCRRFFKDKNKPTRCFGVSCDFEISL
ncbi:MAG: MBL fold metallo-hydrolase [Desulfobacter sp.]|nr:MAG: MBL fold metallo-hydrolase [Desulfobacter sp.]